MPARTVQTSVFVYVWSIGVADLFSDSERETWPEVRGFPEWTSGRGGVISSEIILMLPVT